MEDFIHKNKNINLTGESREIFDSVLLFLNSIKEGESSNLRMSICIALSNLIAGEKLPNIIMELPYEKRTKFKEIVIRINNFRGERKNLAIEILKILEHLTDKVCLLIPSRNKHSNSKTTSDIVTERVGTII